MTKRSILPDTGYWVIPFPEKAAKRIDEKLPTIGRENAKLLFNAYQEIKALRAEMPKPSEAKKKLASFNRKLERFLSDVVEISGSTEWVWLEKQLTPPERGRLEKVKELLLPIAVQAPSITSNIKGGRAPSALNIFIRRAAQMVRDAGSPANSSISGALYELSATLLEAAGDLPADLSSAIDQALQEE